MEVEKLRFHYLGIMTTALILVICATVIALNKESIRKMSTECLQIENTHIENINGVVLCQSDAYAK